MPGTVYVKSPTSTDIRTSGATSPVSSYQVNSEPPACSNIAYRSLKSTFHLNSACASTRPTHSPFRDIIHICTQHKIVSEDKAAEQTPGDTGEPNTGFELTCSPVGAMRFRLRCRAGSLELEDQGQSKVGVCVLQLIAGRSVSSRANKQMRV